MILRTSLFALLVVAIAQLALAAPVNGPDYPAPGGNAFSFSGDLGGVGGRDVTYTGFDIVTPGLVNLWQGLWDPNAAAAALDGSLDVLSFDNVSGPTATWTGTTSWTNPDDSTFYPSVPVMMEITIVSGPVSWSVLPIVGADFDSSLGAVLDNSTGGDYTINILFSADTAVSAGFVPLDTINQGSGGTLTSVSLGFYSQVPEPSTLALAGVGLVAATGYGWSRRRRRRS